MGSFAARLASQAHALRLPRGVEPDVERFVRMHHPGAANPEMVPFRRKLDFWAFAIAVSIATGKVPREGPSRKWGRKFVDTRSVEMSDGLCEMLAIVALSMLGVDHGAVDDSAEIVEVANRMAAAGCGDVLGRLGDRDFRTTPLDKMMQWVKELVGEGEE